MRVISYACVLRAASWGLRISRSPKHQISNLRSGYKARNHGLWESYLSVVAWSLNVLSEAREAKQIDKTKGFISPLKEPFKGNLAVGAPKGNS